MLGIVLMGLAASLFSAACSLLCLSQLRRRERQPAREEEPAEEGEDAALREGILNLLRYAPTEQGSKEE